MSEQNEPQRISANYNPLKIEIPAYLMYLYCSASEIKYGFKIWISEAEFEAVKPAFSPLNDFQTISGTAFENLLDPENSSGQVFAAIETKIREILKIRETEEILWYQVDGDKKIINAETREDSVRSIRNLSNEGVPEGELTFDDVTAENGELLEAAGQICFAYSANKDRTSFLGRILTEKERAAAA